MFGRKRIFLLGLAVFTVASLACGLAGSAGALIAWRAVQGVGRRADDAGDARDHLRTRSRRGSGGGDRHLGRRVGDGARDRPARRRPPHGAHRLELDLLRQRAGRRARHRRGLDRDRRVARHLAHAEPRPAGPPPLGRFAVRAHVRPDRGEPLRLDVAADPRRSSPAPRSDSRPSCSIELHRRAPMLDLSLFRNGTFAGANVVALLVTLAMFGVFFFMSLFVQRDPRLLPRPGGRDLPADDRADHRHRTDRGEAVGQGRLALADGRRADARRRSRCSSSPASGSATGSGTCSPALVIGGVGMACVMTPMSAAAMGAVPVAKAGVASGVLNTFRQIGGALGIAVMGAILTSRESSGARGRGERARGVRRRVPARPPRRRRDRLRRGARPPPSSSGSSSTRPSRPASRRRPSRPASPRRPDVAEATHRPRLAAAERRAAILECRLPRSSRRAATAGRPRPRRSPARPASPSRSSTATSTRKRDLYLACLDESWTRVRVLWEQALAAEPDPAEWLRGDGIAPSGSRARSGS